MNLEICIEDIKRIITAVSISLNVELAVFDIQCRLIASTDEYIKRKGASVHTPSLLEVISTGNVLVNRPGYMPSCIGCRFQSHCPATIEILSTMNIGSQPIGVISMTSFTNEGHEKIAANIGVYIDALNQISYLVAALVSISTQSSEVNYFNSTLKAICDLTNDMIVFLDKAGTIKFYNSEAAKFFPQCTLNSTTLNQIIPDKAIEEILSGNHVKNKVIHNNNLTLSSASVSDNNQTIGTLVCIKYNYEGKNCKTNMYNNISADKDDMENIKGDSEPIIKLKSKILKISNSSSTVLIRGETGTGKGIFAKAIHAFSDRSNLPFVSINCASIPETLFESELFGYEEGAFTGAKRGGKIGKFELAHGGTLFLDEIGDMPIHIQPKLLRVLQEYCIERVGGNRTIPVNVRVIAATNQNLEDMMEKGLFRYDLYYRLNVIPLYIPSLRERTSDIEILVNHFLMKYNERLNKHIKGFSKEVLSTMSSYAWPGNVRELENAVEYAVNIEESLLIEIESLPSNITERMKLLPDTIKNKLENIELKSIKSVLDKYGWDIQGKEKAAKELGISLRTLYRKLKSHE